MKGDHLGELEELVLLAVYGMADDPNSTYGVTVHQHIETLTGRDCTLGAIYSALERLERKACLESLIAAATGERGGRRRRVFALTARGKQTLDRVRAGRDAMWQAAELGRES